MARGVLPFGFLALQASYISDGSDGDLVILNGQTVNLVGGDIKSYSSIDIQLGGTLNIGDGSVVQIACQGSFICNGQIRGTTTNNVANISFNDFWLVEALSHTHTQSNGGAGGGGSQGNAPGSINLNNGGAQSNGHGGGGGGWNGGNLTCLNAGTGGNGQSNGGAGGHYDTNTLTCYASPHANGGAGGTGNQGGHGSPGYWSNVGQTSLAAAKANAYGGNGGGGGGGAGAVSGPVKGNYSSFSTGAGGGARGAHGTHVFILAEEGISGTGTINMSGSNGYNGGGLRTSGPSNAGHNAGGGGGGAGGSGGAIWIRTNDSVTPSISSAPGAGGVNSPQHPGGGNNSYVKGGAPGSSGVTGITNIQGI